jgi:putative transposase
MDGTTTGRRAAYPSDLQDDEWDVIAACIPPGKPGGRRREVDIREVVNAIFYRTKTGCQWRALPHDFPVWQTVNWYWNQWRDSGLWQDLNDLLRRDLRTAAGRHDEPSAAVIDSQSIKSAEKGGRGGMTRARKSRGASAMCSST